MSEKCSKYESLFMFRTQDELEQHVKTCPECAKIHLKMQKVSDLIQEVKPHYIKKQKFNVMKKAACVLLLLMMSITTLGIISTNTDITDTLMYGTTLSAEDLGLPVDSYGLISVE